MGNPSPPSVFDGGSGEGRREGDKQCPSAVDGGPLPVKGACHGLGPQVGRVMIVKGDCPQEPGGQKQLRGL